MIKYIILGVIQGLTEFLPISSSAHLVIFNKFLSAEANLLFYITLHLGTLFSLIIFFFKDIIKLLKDFNLLKKIFIVTLITGIIGILGKDFFERLFSNYRLVSLTLFINGLILIFASKKIDTAKKYRPTYLDSSILGFTQSLAIMPGISRSGITISTLLFRRLEKESAFKFSFLASIPLILGSFFFKLKDVSFGLGNIEVLEYTIGFIAAGVSGYLSLMVLSSLIKKRGLNFFGYYCIIISCLLFIL